MNTVCGGCHVDTSIFSCDCDNRDESRYVVADRVSCDYCGELECIDWEHNIRESHYIKPKEGDPMYKAKIMKKIESKEYNDDIP